MKSRKLLALFLAIFMLASLIVPASAETITPETNVTNGIVGYDAALVEKVDLTDVPEITTIPLKPAAEAEESVQTAYTNYTLGKEYKISSPESFKYLDKVMSDQVDNKGVDKKWILSGVTIYLAQDIDFDTDASEAVIKDTINPIGNYANNSWAPYCFAGIFDGQGYAIKNVKIYPKNATQVTQLFYGLFTCVSATKTTGSAIKNLIIDESVEFDATAGETLSLECVHVASLIGTVDTRYGDTAQTKAAVGTVTIENILNNADLSYNSKVSGGLVCFAKCVHIVFKNCTNAGDLTQSGTSACAAHTGENGVGGIVGALGERLKNDTIDKEYYLSADVLNCRNTGDVKPAKEGDVGGLVGAACCPLKADKSVHPLTTPRVLNITNCINNGDVIFTNETANSAWSAYGGIFGWNCGWSSVAISGCANYGTVTSNKSGCHNGISTSGTKTNNINLAGGMDPTYNMVAKYYQMSNKTYKNTEDADCYSLRLVALHNGDLDKLDSYAYTVTIKYGTDSVVTASTGELTSVRTEIAVDDKLGTGVTKISASTLGADYVSAVCINNIPTSIGAIEVTIVPTMTKGETTTTAAPITFTVDPAVYNAQ